MKELGAFWMHRSKTKKFPKGFHLDHANIRVFKDMYHYTGHIVTADNKIENLMIIFNGRKREGKTGNSDPDLYLMLCD